MSMQSQQVTRPGAVLAVLALAAFMASLDVFIVNVAFDAIGKDFSGSSISQLSWVLNAYAIAGAALLTPASLGLVLASARPSTARGRCASGPRQAPSRRRSGRSSAVCWSR